MRTLRNSRQFDVIEGKRSKKEKRLGKLAKNSEKKQNIPENEKKTQKKR